MKITILNTGASSGIGKAVAQQLASEGHGLIIVAGVEPCLNQLKDELEQKHSVNII